MALSEAYEVDLEEAHTSGADALAAEQAKLEEILGSPAALKRTVIKEIEADAKQYGDDRRTQIVPFDGDMSMEDLIPAEDVVVTITVDGETLEHELPVLDHTFQRYAEYIPGGAPSTPANPSNTPAPEDEEEGGHHRGPCTGP